MAEHSHAFLTLSILTLLTILLIFGMKYFSQARSAQVGAGGLGALLGAVSGSRETHAGNVEALRADLAEMKSRLAAIETLLREVQ